MHPNQQSIETFYSAFARLDPQAMAGCYAQDASFDDEVFSLRGRDSGQAHWDAHYRFSSTGRIVDNSIDARFTFNPQSQIASHRDSFDFWSWSRQALGAPGYLLGWTPQLRNKVRAQGASNLRSFLSKEAR